MARKTPVLKPARATSCAVTHIVDGRREPWSPGPGFPPTWMEHDVCGSPVCGRHVYARGLCEAHWARWRKGGDLMTPIRGRGANRFQTIIRCYYCGMNVGASGLTSHERKCFRDNASTLLQGRRCTDERGSVSWAMNGNMTPPLPIHHEAFETWVKVGDRETIHGAQAALFEIGRTENRRIVTQIDVDQVLDYRDNKEHWIDHWRQRALRRTTARQRAIRLLRSFLSPAEDEMLRVMGWIPIIGSAGNGYILTMERQHNIYEVDREKMFAAIDADKDLPVAEFMLNNLVAEYCIEVAEGVPLEDNFLSQMLLITRDEYEFRRIANKTPMRQRPDGGYDFLEPTPRGGSKGAMPTGKGGGMENKKLLILVPADPKTLVRVEPKSAIVGHVGLHNPKMMHIYFEGGLYDPRMTYRDKVRLAAGRCLEKYPTVARMVVPRGTVKVVGTYEFDVDRIHIDDDEGLDEWLGTDEAADDEEAAE